MFPKSIEPGSPIITSTSSSLFELDEVLRQVLAQAVSAARAQCGFILLRDSESALKLYAASGVPPAAFDAANYQAARDLAIRTSESSETQQFRGDSHIPSYLCVPLVIKSDSIGVILLERRSPHSPFSPNDTENLKMLAQPAALAIQATRLYSDAEGRLKNLQLLQEISADLTSTLDVKSVLTTCLERVQSVLHIETATILIREEDELLFQIAIGETADRVKPFRLKMGQGITGWVAQNAKGYFTNDVQNDPRYYRTVDTELHFVTRSLIAAPLIVNDRVIGVISATNKRDGFATVDLDLLTTIAGSAAIAIENARLYQVAVEKGRMERELQVARQVQSSLIPLGPPHFNGWDIAAMWEPAREVSGDYYDFLHISNQLDLILADVSDKGTPSALFMAHTRSIVRACLSPARSLARGMTKANDLVCANNANDMFVTMCAVRVMSKSGKIVCVNAGHNRPLVYDSKQGGLVELKRTGIALGVEEKSHFSERIIQLRRGDFLVLYTDGVTDATNAQGEFFGEERLKQALSASRDKRAEQMIAELKGSINGFVGSAPPADDITVVIAKRQ